MPRGRRFLCTECGNCCRQPGFVALTLAELRALARYLDCTITELRSRHEIRWDPRDRQYEIVAGADGCPFLDGDLCSVHEVKPHQCRQFPFWPELVADPGAWKEAKEVCEGLDHPRGTLYSIEQMRELARRRSSIE